MRLLRVILLTIAMLAMGAVVTPMGAQERSREYAVSASVAVDALRDVMGRSGFEIVRIENDGGDRIVYYRRGNNGRGKGKGRPERIVIRRVESRIVFEGAPSGILVDIDVRLRLPIG